MPLDFPTSPTNGQVYDNWIYSTAKGAWQSKPLTPAKTLVSSTAPSSPAVGDQWFNSNDGTLYIYYNDGNTSQWVESRSPITADGYKSPNYVINGAFDIWQRGTSISSSGGSVGADMWREYTDSGSGTQAIDTADYPEGLPAQSYRFTAGANSTNWSLFQIIESANCAPIVGKTVTVSLYLESSVARTIRVNLSSSTTVDAAWTGSWANFATQDFSVGTTWARYSFTATVPSTAKTLQVGISSNGANIANGTIIKVAGVQLEEGVSATRFRRNANSIAEELATCQRYYYRIVATNLYGQMGIGIAEASNQATIMVKNPVTMRVPATAVEHSGTGVWDSVNFYTVNTLTLKSGHSSRENSVVTIVVGANPLPQFRPYFLIGGNNVASYVGFSAEL